MKDILDYLESVDICLSTEHIGATRAVSKELARMFAKKNFSREQIEAHFSGVTVETYRKWQKWVAEGRPCQALTLQGRRCRFGISWPAHLSMPYEFERNGFCAMHWKKFNE